MYTSTVNISKMVTDRANITIDIEYEVAYGLSISIFNLAYSIKVKDMHILTVNISKIVMILLSISFFTEIYHFPFVLLETHYLTGPISLVTLVILIITLSAY